MTTKSFRPDPRYFQVLFQLFFLIYGIGILGWPPNWPHYATCIGACLLFNYLAESAKQKRFMSLLGKNGFARWGFSVLISAMSLCLLLKTNHWSTSALACALTVGSKYIFHYKGKHIFNPSAFGIVATLLLTHDAWLSPGQWGNDAILFFTGLTFGTIVVTRVQKLDTSLAFLFTFAGLLFCRQVLVLHWPIDHFIHSLSTGSLFLFAFFMISDPRTSPNHLIARIAWAAVIAGISFYLAAFKWKYNTSVWILVAAAPLVPLLDHFFKAKAYQWNAATSHATSNFFKYLKKIIMRPSIKKLTASLVLMAMISHEAIAFCGFYVSKADGTLKNKTSQVILVRDGNRNVVTMYNDFKGNLKDFAMVVPVPVVLKKSDIKVVDQKIFQTLNDYSQPRLVEYFDQNPCANNKQWELNGKIPGVQLNEVVVSGYGNQRKKELGVRIEAKYLVGEYDILILSAQESSGLKTWLEENGYKIPAGAEEVLEPYIKSGLKFFVVKVNEEEKKKLPGDFLRPIQISFTSPKFMLPIRLGMANSDGDQDMIVYAFTKKGRVESTNYRTVSLPTGNNVPLFVQDNFSNFYSNLFQHQWAKEGQAVVMLEYAWDVSPKNYVKCDPCVATAPSTQDLVQAGVWWLNRNWNDYSDVNGDEEEYSDNVYFTRLHVRYNRAHFPQDLVFQATPNTENFQARYIITHPATGDLSCPEGQKYLKTLKERRKGELEMLTYLTGKGYSDWDALGATKSEMNMPAENSYAAAAMTIRTPGKRVSDVWLAPIAIAGVIVVGRLRKKKDK
jgi:Na+-translocating ferredoxin:NAD+ oxidoreductase RnfD subunit